MAIGYPCLTLGVLDTNFRTCIMKNASNEKLIELIEHNLNSLENIIEYNILNDIKLFRISSDIIPFASSPVNDVLWWNIFSSKLLLIGEKIKKSNIRVSMHPGQYTVLNSPNEGVVERAIKDLEYHNKFLDSLGVEENCKIILHIGGVYGQKQIAKERFKNNYRKLDRRIKERLVIENDDKSYNIEDVVEIGKSLNIPVIFDNLHNFINPSSAEKTDLDWITICNKTWAKEDGTQKIHYSQQNPLKKPGGHSESIKINEFIDFYNRVEGKNIDIMLEVKDKNISAVKCINSVTDNRNNYRLEKEWERYKYKILEKDNLIYNKIRQLLIENSMYPVIEFYNLIEEALEKKELMESVLNCAFHVWNNFNGIATGEETNKFFNSLDLYKNGQSKSNNFKKILWKLSVKYHKEELLNSYYFL